MVIGLIPLTKEKAQTACWLVGRVGDERDADALISTLSSQRRELWILQQLPSVSSLLRRKAAGA
ncbi:hypothetical protein [Nostoc sp.]|uniref:hypothetical protein n=1 Tax=Nostoc sp. TaxID=1180 RepID=UPI002FF20D0B